MANIYEEKNESLHQLIDRAKSDDGATVVIPDLQRPYVWTPNQVLLLVDSLIRGWPFGTLLMWKVADGQLQSIPHRSFWKVVDRTDGGASSTVSRKDPPAAFHMVLDGQQRVQSILLALGGDGWGFKMDDRDWVQEIHERRPRGRRGKFTHWTKASVCFDLNMFLDAYKEHNSILGIDYRTVLHWVVTDPADGKSKMPKPGNYEEPLFESYVSANRGRFIRLSRLWGLTTPNPNLKEAQFRQALEPFLKEEGVDEALVVELLPPMAELLSTLRDVKLSKITYLELLPFDPTVWDEDTYNDAIVNVFTRLNTAGRTLTREEITLAWLKVGWDPALTGKLTAGECFNGLQASLADQKLSLGIDDLVGVVSFMWATRFNAGGVLGNKDLLKGSAVRPMATNLASNWSVFEDAANTVTRLLNDRDLSYGPSGHYASLNALSVLCGWAFLAFLWERDAELTVPQRTGFRDRVVDLLAESSERWLLCTQWAGTWAGSANRAIADFCKALHEDWAKLAKCGSHDGAFTVLKDRMTAMLAGPQADAVANVKTIDAGASRQRVAYYRNLLWIWHRLDGQRWKMSQIQLRHGRSRSARLDVDHTVAFALWDGRLKSEGLPEDLKGTEEAEAIINQLGNCSLLEKSFNISKNAKSLSSFLDEVRDFQDGIVDRDEWMKALGLSDVFLRPDAHSVAEIRSAIEERDQAIRADLEAFVIGTKSRADLA